MTSAGKRRRSSTTSPPSGQKPPARARLPTWSGINDALYYAASMTDAELRSFGTKRNDTLWEGDVFELFFKPSAQRARVFRVSSKSAHGRIRDGLSQARRKPSGLHDGPNPGQQGRRRASRERSINPAIATWAGRVEGRIPWSAFAAGGGKPKPGDEWLFALCRYDYGPDGTRPVLDELCSAHAAAVPPLRRLRQAAL